MIKSARSGQQTLTEAARRELHDAIAEGAYRPGSQLPTEAELVELLGVSRTVVREALRALEEDGLIARRHGVGTFVRNRPILKDLNYNFGITEMIESAGLTPGTSFFEMRREAAQGKAVAQLAVAAGTPLITIERVRTADGKPVVYSLDTFPESLVRGDPDPNRLLKESLYQTLQAEFGLVIEYGVAKILPAQAAAPIAEKLALAEGSLLLYVVQTDYSSADAPVLYSQEYHLPDAFDFVIWRRGPAKLRRPAPAAE